MSTQSAIKALVTEHWKRDDKNIDAAINQSYKEVLSIIPHHKNQERVYRVTVRGVAVYPLPETFFRLNHPLKIIDPTANSSSTSSYPLRFLNKDEYDFIEPNPDVNTPTTGFPWAYAVWKNSLYLTAIPDRVYTIEFNMGGEAGPFLVPDAVSILAPEFDETIAAGALKRLFGGVKLYDDSAYWQNVYINGHTGDQGSIMGGIKLLKQIEEDNFNAVKHVRNNCL